MIELGGENISILYADGTSAFFDPEELRQRLEKSFSAAGRAESWIAGEIVLSVEYALRGQSAGDEFSGQTVHAADIDRCVERILEDSGYPEVANHFRNHAVSSGDLGKLSPDGVEQYLAEKLQLTGSIGKELSARIRQAMSAIGAARCSPRLILELARYFRETAAVPHRLPVPAAAGPGFPAAAAPVEEKFLQIHRSDAIFPSIRVEIDLLRLFEKCTLTPPLTELSLSPILLPVAGQIDSACLRLRTEGAGNCPLLLTLRGFADFAAKWLCYESEMSQEMLYKRGRSFTAYFYSLLGETPFKTFIR